MDNMIEITRLSKAFGENPVLRDISLNVKKGDVVALIGPSGSGKSTLLRSINLLTIPDTGSIRVGTNLQTFDRAKTRLPGDKALSAFRSRTGMVFQHFNLFPHLTVLRNVMEGMLAVLRTPKAEAAEHARRSLEKVGLADKAEMYPDRLSGGQKQRVAIARALAMRPEVMLFDEATSALDPELVGEVLGVIRSLAEDGMTMLLVTHEMDFAREVADQVVFMRDGVVVETGSPQEVLQNPSHPLTQSFLARYHTAESTT
ncbi:Arginine transport ATP-binding protein ArtM [Paraburkholderia aspalathi]|uniref:amino acid ABC transporter ATP-binding protein n=1 Tax=Paraburkholderia aspalathi TaxID=1324617 RepID=UPI001B1471A8|nr:amino acid ABC transporter ATP-binding protein [Paraburkholderia aspalathi]CAE6848014.1 Arginine transport ATP-binding protein ArtM [Paraburkholderia aspalathi]CAE6858016.1 Arginine transport ATP-binding protein ArtM [Paraburkholderia aspalathi]